MSNTESVVPVHHAELRAAYIELLKNCLTFSLWEAKDGSILEAGGGALLSAKIMALKVMKKFGSGPTNQEMREEGKDWPTLGDTMIGRKRINNLQFCVESTIRDGIPGDLIETGVWRGGATVFMRGILKAYGITDKKVWVADSFEGLPKPDEKNYPADSGDKHFTFKSLAISIDDVKANFAKYGLLDDQVQFLKGWFKDTLPGLSAEKLSVVRLDGDMYQSTMDGLVNLYPKLSSGGYIIIDDYGAVPACKQAVEDFRRKHNISEPIENIDWTGSYWRKK